MKVIIFVIASILAVQATTDEQQKRLEKISRECVQVSNVDLKVLEAAEKGGPLTDDPKMKIHGFCFSKKIGLQNEKGDFQPQVIRDRLNAQTKDSAAVEKLLALCLVANKTPEDTGLAALACFRKNSPKDVVVY